ncbi:MAG: hydrogenase maturation peptidase HycI [Methanolinea sp.]|nr:hydrogenase maturation peptidase HycI [Methanolinea sp.]
MVNILLGVGNPLRRDDGAGNYVAANFRRPGWMSLDCGTVPENFTGVVRREHPALLVIVDAAEMGRSPGAFCVIPKERIRDVSFGTHQLPLDVIVDYLAHSAGRIVMIGIQPRVVETGEGLSSPVREGADRLIGYLARGELDTIPVFR